MINRLRLIVSIAVMALVQTSGFCSAETLLKQSVQPLDCNYTKVQTGDSEVNNTDCTPFDPIITEIDKNGGKPIFRGIYDASHTQKLKVFFADEVYRVGTDIQATSNGNVWIVSLANRQNAFPPGRYLLVVEAEMESGRIGRDSAVVVLTEHDKQHLANETSEANDDRRASDADDNAMLVPLLIVAAITMAGVCCHLLLRIYKLKS